MSGVTDADDGDFGIVITSQMRHGDLWKARQSLGSSKALAEKLGVDQQTIGAWINLKRYPGYTRPQDSEMRSIIESKLYQLTGKSLVELWPVRLMEAIDGGKMVIRIETRTQIGLNAIATQQKERLMLPSPETITRRNELFEKLEQGLDRLCHRERQILRWRFGFDAGPTTYEHMGEKLNISKERTRQICARGLRKLRIVIEKEIDATDLAMFDELDNQGDL